MGLGREGGQEREGKEKSMAWVKIEDIILADKHIGGWLVHLNDPYTDEEYKGTTDDILQVFAMLYRHFVWPTWEGEIRIIDKPKD